MASLDSFFASVKLPSMSEVAHALIKSLNNEDVPVAEVTAIIARDPALTAKLLRLANSAQFGLAKKVASLDDAVAMIGMSKVRTLCLGACMSDSFPVVAGLDRKVFWQSSMRCAGYSQWLAGALGADAQAAWLTGLMLRLGELLIAQADPAALLEIEKLPHIPGGRWEREIRLLGHSEGQITGELARRWNFPHTVVHALQTSADPLGSAVFSKLGAVVHLAELLAESELSGAAAVDALPADVVKALLLDAQWMTKKYPAAESFVDVSGS